MEDKRLQIAVGVIFNKKKDKVLVARRPARVHQGGLWEFPGGKVEFTESLEEALDCAVYLAGHIIELQEKTKLPEHQCTGDECI